VNAGDVAAIVVAVAVAILSVGLLFALFSMIRTLRLMRGTVEQFRREALPLVSELRTTVVKANAELDRVDGLLGSAESISGTVDSASRLAYLAFANPVVKLMALGAGTARAARRLRRRSRQ
jgi:uncharacterized protein YoxC